MIWIQIRGISALSAAGLSKEAIFENAIQKKSFVDESGRAQINDTDWSFLKSKTPATLSEYRSTCLGFSSIQNAIADAGWESSDLSTAGLIYATTTGKIDEWEQDLPYHQKENYDIQKLKKSVSNQSLGTPALQLAAHFGIKGPHCLVASSCSASLQALNIAYWWLKLNKVKRVLVVSTEVHCQLTQIGFHSLRLLTRGPCKPFDKNRVGINLGEGSATLCLEATDSPVHGKSWGLLSGVGMSTDAYHPTAPHPEGLGSQESMQQALSLAKINASEVDWVYAHGTGSPANDFSESFAINKHFPLSTLVSSTKSVHGHTLGACGALESSLGLFAMAKNIILPSVGMTDKDPQIEVTICSSPVEKKYQHFLKNSLGFGGMNASILFSRNEAFR